MYQAIKRFGPTKILNPGFNPTKYLNFQFKGTKILLKHLFLTSR